MTQREILIGLAIEYESDWEKIFEHLSLKQPLDLLKKYEKLLPNLPSKVITILDDEYPDHLKSVNRPPFVLFYHGDITLLKRTDDILSVVGSREYSEYGKRKCEEILGDLAKEVIVCSGMAIGIDTIAHTCALVNKGKTIAVLGSGINYPYPARNKQLYEKIKKNGLIISEYFDKKEPSPEKFPYRNRIVGGLCKTLFIPEGKVLSGTSITASCALRCGADICCLPYLAGTNSLCNELIRDGAYLVENSNDIRTLMGKIKHEPIF